jgi:phosphatidylserine/phosphatidylglycerophosphate/cardiolipin synthase-like enzyme
VSVVVIKNIRLDPAAVDNDGEARVQCVCTVLTAAENAAIKSVEIDLAPLGATKRAPLKLDRSERLRGTLEGRYGARFAVPALAEPGRSELPLIARDTAGNVGRARAAVQVRYRRRPSAGELTAPDNLRALERAGRAPVVAGNRITPLHDGGEAMERRIALLAGAKQQINLQTYIFNAEGAGGRHYQTLLGRVDAGVEANIFLNGDTQIPAALLSTLRLAFHRLLSEISEFLETRIPAAPADREQFAFLGRLAEWRKPVNLIFFSGSRLRERGLAPVTRGEPPAVWLRKLLDDAAGDREPIDWLGEEDGRGALYQGPGGLPAIPLLDYAAHEKILVVDGRRAIVGGRNLSEEYFSPWIDADLLIEGPVVRRIQNGFFESFREFADEHARGPQPAPCPAKCGAAGEQRVQFVQSRPWRNERPAMNTLVTAFQLAQQRVFIYSQYVVLPDGLLLDALLDAARRGVDVRILTNSQTTAQDVNLGAGYYISLNYFGRLLDAGVRLFLVNGDPLLKGIQPYLHVKEFLIDGRLACFGSFNLSIRSCFIESENLVNVFDPRLAEGEEALFLERCGALANELTQPMLRDQLRQHRGKMGIARNFELLF